MRGVSNKHCLLTFFIISGIPLAPDHSCSDKRGMNNKTTKLKRLCFFIHVYLQATCEMIEGFASLICVDATCKT